MGDVVKFRDNRRGICVEQRQDSGFINTTAMAVAHGKDISDWFRTDDNWELVEALADDLGVKIKNHKSGNSVYTRVAACYPSLVTVKRGSPENDGGTWIHPDLAIDCASWCSKRFAIRVGRWVQQWFVNNIIGSDTGSNDEVIDGEIQDDTGGFLSIGSDDFNQNVRITPDGRVSVYDAIGYVTGHSNPRDVWSELIIRIPEVVGFSDNFQFEGQGQRLTPVATVEVFLEILTTLPGRIAVISAIALQLTFT